MNQFIMKLSTCWYKTSVKFILAKQFHDSTYEPICYIWRKTFGAPCSQVITLDQKSGVIFVAVDI
jgi:hypothetical protein